MELPILIIAWKRPIHLRKLIDSLRIIKPKYLYLACDGPRSDFPEEEELVYLTKYILDNEIDWSCVVKKLYSINNQGCRSGVSNAISWFFQNVSEGIILEDDCIPHPDFYNFAKIMIETYRNDKRIWNVCGVNFQQGKWIGEGSYYFSKFSHCWGWATWRDRWINYSDEEVIWQRLKNSKIMQNIFDSKRELKYWNSIFEKLYNHNQPDTWDYRWFLVCQVNRGLSIIPNLNLVENIGFGDAATNTKKGTSPINLDFDKDQPTGIFPLKKPFFTIRSIDADYFTFSNFFDISLKNKLLNLIKNKLKNIKVLLLKIVN